MLILENVNAENVKEMVTDPSVFKINPEEIAALRSIQKKCYLQSAWMGWHSKPRDFGTLIALMHSELSEALEGNRKDKMDDHLPERKQEEVEFADCIIRILDACGKYNWNVADALAEKLNYNRVRSDHQLKNRMKSGGKAY